MKNTGIVRKIDDLGRIVIPIDIRKNLRIREGDSLEIFVDDDCVCFKKLYKYGNCEWKMCARVLHNIIENFAILDGRGKLVEAFNVNVSNKDDAEKDTNLALLEIGCWNGSPLAYLVVQNNIDEEKMITSKNIFRTILYELI